MSPESRRLAGILLVLLPIVVCGGVSILSLLINNPRYMQNALRQDLWRAAIPSSAILLLVGFFFSVLLLGVGLIRKHVDVAA